MAWKCGTPGVRKAQRRAASRTRLENMTVVELRALCKKKELKGYSIWNKDQLIREIMKKRDQARKEKEIKLREKDGPSSSRQKFGFPT